MKTINLRNFIQKKFNRTCPTYLNPTSTVYDVLDKKLADINASFTHNFHLIDILLDLTKNKRTLRSHEIKEYYHLFTENKAESLIFINNLEHEKSDPFEPYLQNAEAVVHLKRLYCRLIEKMMVKISYFLINRKTLGFLYPQALELIKRCEILTRRLNFMKDTSSIGQIVSSVFAQNQELMQKIIGELIDKGFIISADEFYRINGVDLDHRQYFQRNKTTIITQQSQQPLPSKEKKKAQSPRSSVKFSINLKKELPKRLIKRSESHAIDLKKMENPPQVQRTGWVQLEDKYRNLLISLEQMINQENEEIQEEKEENQPEEEESENQENKLKENNDILDDLGEEENQHREGHTENNSTERSHIESSSLTRTRKIKQKASLISSPLSKIDLNKDFVSQRDKQEEQIDFDSLKSEHPPRQINHNGKYHTQVFVQRKAKPAGTFPFFSKGFMKAIFQMQKMNLKDTNDRLGIKRMSEQLLVFHKDEEEERGERTAKKVFTIKNAIKHKGARNSITKLLNIYKNKKEEERKASVKKSHLSSRNSANESLINCRNSHKEPIKASIFRPRPSLVSNALHNNSSLPSINHQQQQREKEKRWLRHNASQQWLNGQMQQIFMESSINSPKTPFSKKLDFSMSRFTAPLSTVLSTSFRSSPRQTYDPSQLTQDEVKAVQECLHGEKEEPFKDDSIFTNRGIKRMQRVSFQGMPVLSSILTRLSPQDGSKWKGQLDSHRRFQVFDRLRRVILR